MKPVQLKSKNKLLQTFVIGHTFVLIPQHTSLPFSEQVAGICLPKLSLPLGDLDLVSAKTASRLVHHFLHDLPLRPIVTQTDHATLFVATARI